MSAGSNGVIRVGRKGRKKFAFGEGEPFEVDVVVAFQEWICIDDGFRERGDDRSHAGGDQAGVAGKLRDGWRGAGGGAAEKRQ